MNRQILYLRPDPARVVVRPFKPATEPRALNSKVNAGSGKHGSAATGQCAFPANAEATAPQQYGSFLLVWFRYTQAMTFDPGT
jgi:hypothetical protein